MTLCTRQFPPAITPTRSAQFSWLCEGQVQERDWNTALQMHDTAPQLWESMWRRATVGASHLMLELGEVCKNNLPSTERIQEGRRGVIWGAPSCVFLQQQTQQLPNVFWGPWKLAQHKQWHIIIAFSPYLFSPKNLTCQKEWGDLNQKWDAYSLQKRITS